MADSEDGARPIDSGEYGSLDTLIACTLLQKDIAITTFSATVSRTAPVSRSHELSRGRRPSGPYRTENELPISHNVAHRRALLQDGERRRGRRSVHESDPHLRVERSQSVRLSDRVAATRRGVEG